MMIVFALVLGWIAVVTAVIGYINSGIRCDCDRDWRTR